MAEADAGRRTDTHVVRAALRALVPVLAFVLVWFALLAPDRASRLGPAAFVRIPLEGLVVAAIVLALPPRPRRVVAAVAGVLLGLVTVLALTDIGFRETLGRAFDPVVDWRYASSGVSFLSDSIGRTRATVVVVATGVMALGLLVLMPLAVLRLTQVLERHRGASFRGIAALVVVWLLGAVTGAQVVHGSPIAARSAAELVREHVADARADYRDQREFSRQIAIDPLRDTPRDQLLTGLRGKDVVIAFVESYGRVAVQGSAFSPRVDAVLDSGSARLRAAGFSSRSAFLHSPTFGAISWLAHSTLQSGLWVDSQRRYDTLMGQDRFTLSDAFKRAGWRTVGDVPANTHDWPEGTSFYHYDKLYDSRNVGYAGPKFGYSTMPDQYTLSAFRRLELARHDRAPLMAEIDLISSHAPWAPLPRTMPWEAVGDGSVFDGMPAQGDPRDVVWRDPTRVRAAYGQSVEYTLSTLISFLETNRDPDLVLVVLGDHEPATVVSGDHSSRDVPVTVISRDPAVMRRISPWAWQDGLRPRPDAPVWRMDAFRDRFLTAFGPAGDPRRALAGRRP